MNYDIFKTTQNTIKENSFYMKKKTKFLIAVLFLFAFLEVIEMYFSFNTILLLKKFLKGHELDLATRNYYYDLIRFGMTVFLIASYFIIPSIRKIVFLIFSFLLCWELYASYTFGINLFYTFKILVTFLLIAFLIKYNRTD
jgi:hypothetical protein